MPRWSARFAFGSTRGSGAATGGDLRLVAELNPLYSGFNHAIFVVGTALAFPVIAVSAMGIAILTVGMDRKQIETVPIMVVEFAVIFGGPLAMIPCYAWLSSRIIARGPARGLARKWHFRRVWKGQRRS